MSKKIILIQGSDDEDQMALAKKSKIELVNFAFIHLDIKNLNFKNIHEIIKIKKKVYYVSDSTIKNIFLNLNHLTQPLAAS